MARAAAGTGRSARPSAKAEAKSASGLERYWAKRDFAKTPEPHGAPGKASKQPAFVIQKHHASQLHYDFRLEVDGVMKSWAVPKGPSYDPSVKRMAVQVEDHPISYNTFEGTIPKGQYGAGSVIIWDRGSWEPQGDPRKGLAAGKLAFRMNGAKMHGLWELVRMRKPDRERQQPWLLFKKHDEFERTADDYDVVSALPDSVVSKPVEAARPAATRAATRTGTRAATPPGVRKALPESLSPQLATLATGVPATGEWIYEIKLDGYRVMTRIAGAGPALLTRGGHDWSSKMPALVAQIKALGIKSGWLDGEIVVMGDDGVPHFNALQNALDSSRTNSILYFLFDVPFLDGRDLRQLPLRERRAILKALLDGKGGGQLRFSDDFKADAASVLQTACRMKLEGVIAKRADAPYVSRRTETWLKLKCNQRQEFVIVGFTDRKGEPKAAAIGSLLLGYHDAKGKLVFAGSVGTGWNSRDAAAIKARLLKIEVEKSPFDADEPRRARGSRRAGGAVRWVKPSAVAEVSFTEWTPDGRLRHPSFEGLRADKPANAITRERAVTPATTVAKKAVPAAKKAAPAAKKAAPAAKNAGPSVVGSIKVTHPERVIDSSSGLTKLDLVRYYESVAQWMAPHLKGRACALLRGPSGIEGQLFFQKHLDRLRIAQVKELDRALWPEHDPLLEVPNATAIVAAAQMNVIEFHTWNSQVKNFDKPDRIVFDLDPGEGVDWKRVQEGAALTRSLLQQLDLEAWLKTSGGKGLHLVVPIAPRQGWPVVRALAQAVVEQLAHVIPDRFVAKSGPANRVGKIFVDYLRNTNGATTAAAYSARARPGLGVSMPVDWEQLAELTSGAHWTIKTAPGYLSSHAADPWKGYWAARQPVSKAMKALGVPAAPPAAAR
jgi:bifunctional non-homologous end joining protein LigD